MFASESGSADACGGAAEAPPPLLLLLLPLLPLLLSVPAGAEFEGSERMPLQGVYGEYTPWSGAPQQLLTHWRLVARESHRHAIVLCDHAFVDRRS